MRRILAALLSAALAVSSLAFAYPHGRTPIGRLGAASGGGGGGQTLVFSYPSGFTSAHSNFTLANGDTVFSDPNIQIPVAGTHVAAAAWYNNKQTITSFTTEFTFTLTNSDYGFNFVIQNDPSGTGSSADANGLGYFTYTTNVPDNAIHDSVAVVFNTTPASGTSAYYPAATPSMVGLYVDGGPFIDNGIYPVQDAAPQGVNLLSGHIMDALVTYDGTNLQMVVRDTATGAKATYSWPVNISSIVGASTAYVGFTGGCASGGTCGPGTLNSWTWYSGYNTELSAPTFSPTPGQYASSQTVSISGPSGATIYYTTNGKPPNTSSSVYSTPITVSATEAIQAIAVESNFTNSAIGLGNYQIQASGPTINFPSTFAGTGLLQLAGMATLNGAALQITDGVNAGELGSAFYVAPVSVASFSTTFVFKANPGAVGAHGGITFLLTNQGPTAFYSVAYGLASAPSSGATSATLSSGWVGSTGPRSIAFTDGETRSTTLTNGSTAISWTGGLTSSVGANITIVRATNTGVSGGPYSIGGGAYQAGTAYGAMGIGNSVGIVLDCWNNAIGISINGALPTETAISGINACQNSDQIQLTYSGTTLALTLEDLSTLATFSHNFTSLNIASQIGASTGYVGFTGAYYDAGSPAQQITSWTGF